MKVGDLVRPKRKCIHGRNIGLVVYTGTGLFEDQCKVLWDKPTWYDPNDGLSVEYPRELEVICESR